MMNQSIDFQSFEQFAPLKICHHQFLNLKIAQTGAMPIFQIACKSRKSGQTGILIANRAKIRFQPNTLKILVEAIHKLHFDEGIKIGIEKTQAKILGQSVPKMLRRRIPKQDILDILNIEEKVLDEVAKSAYENEEVKLEDLFRSGYTSAALHELLEIGRPELEAFENSIGLSD